ncbi:deoxyribonuclease IV [Cohnella yongneupensis]|uniref:Deoxyribonuclease IV n=1 Tax=Cohnella yongneupensis TaxID=425006 RepID=A0ABW0R576_9BACL
MHIGSHVSTRGSYRQAAEHAVSIGANAFQYFPKNPRTLEPKTFSEQDASRCRAWCLDRGIASIAHGPYLVNPAATGEASDRMAACTLNDLAIAEACGSIGVVVHFGVHKGKDPLEGYRNIIQWINKVASDWHGDALILLENQAGDHGPMGTAPEEWVQIRSLCDEPDKIGFCLDTCHLFASGVWEPGGWQAFAERARKLRMWDSLRAVHLNDSLFQQGSRKDRHAPIGAGYIGEDGFREVLATPEIRKVPLFLETPTSEGRSHREQIVLARRLSEED